MEKYRLRGSTRRPHDLPWWLFRQINRHLEDRLANTMHRNL
jgi:hypothetical protein